MAWSIRGEFEFGVIAGDLVDLLSSESLSFFQLTPDESGEVGLLRVPPRFVRERFLQKGNSRLAVTFCHARTCETFERFGKLKCILGDSRLSESLTILPLSVIGIAAGQSERTLAQKRFAFVGGLALSA